MAKYTKYFCIEGVEGVGKTTQVQKLVDHLRSLGYKVLQTKEPGTAHAPITMTLRNIMLDKQYDADLTPEAREFISQAIRSIHLDKVIIPAMQEYDYIIQDRGILSGLAYGTACGNDFNDLQLLTKIITQTIMQTRWDGIYDCIIYLKGDTSTSLTKALTAKQEFAAGDAIEARGSSFMDVVARNMDAMSKDFPTKVVSVDGKNIEEVFTEILQSLNL
jgi:dTMP kinase